MRLSTVLERFDLCQMHEISSLAGMVVLSMYMASSETHGDLHTHEGGFIAPLACVQTCRISPSIHFWSLHSHSSPFPSVLFAFPVIALFPVVLSSPSLWFNLLHFYTCLGQYISWCKYQHRLVGRSMYCQCKMNVSLKLRMWVELGL